MKKFFSDTVLLNSVTSTYLYNEIKSLPIIDYHCHLDQCKIEEDCSFSDIGELWLKNDHYKWRAMRLCGVDEQFVTGEASFHDKFLKFASIMPRLIGNPIYYWVHFELKQIFNINKPLNAENAEEIYSKANEVLKKIRISDLFKLFNVEYVATTDDPCDNLTSNGKYANVTVSPTFRPDKAFDFFTYKHELEKAINKKIFNVYDYLNALEERLDYFVRKNCKIADHGISKFPSDYIDDDIADELFRSKEKPNQDMMDKFTGWLLVKLAKMYSKRKITMQIHFSVLRNCNEEMFKRCGKDSGFDLIGNIQNGQSIISFLNQLKDNDRPNIILYTLNDSNLKEIAAITGAFRNVRIGPSWWFNDTVEGIKHNLSVIAEYSVLGEFPGMLTDSRSFSSFSRFDFFRRIVCDYVAKKVEDGEYDIQSAISLLNDICYRNAKEMIK